MSAAVRVIALSGGIGGAKLALGLYRLLPPDCLMVACNTGDDFEHLGLRISPDLDTVTYMLAGIANPETGWGRAGETWTFMAALRNSAARPGSPRRRRSGHPRGAHPPLGRGGAPERDHRRLLRAPGHSRPGRPDVRRAGTHHGAHRGRPHPVPALLRGTATRTQSERVRVPRRRGGATDAGAL